MKQTWWLAGLMAALMLGGTAVHPSVVRAEEELAVEEDAPADDAPAEAAPAAAPAQPAAKAKPAAKPKPAGAAIVKIAVVPVDGRTELRITGRGTLTAKIQKINPHKLVLDFAGARYAAPKIILNAPGLGEIKAVRGAQFKPGVARVVVELGSMVAYTDTAAPGSYTVSFATKAEAGPDAGDAAMAASAPAGAATGAAFPTGPGATEVMDGGTGRARVLHAMVTDLPDRARLVVTADGVLRYKLSSQAEGKELNLALYDVDLKWAPPRLAFKDGPIVDVRADQVSSPAPQVRVAIRLRAARSYHVRRDQNQVIVEVEKANEAEAEAADTAARRGDLNHKVTMNVQNEDMAAMVKALAFEAGFENVVFKERQGVAEADKLVTISLRDVAFAKALNLILAPREYVWKVERGILRISTQSAFEAEIDTVALSGGAAGASAGGDDEGGGYVTRVFRLRYASVGFSFGGTFGPLAGGGMSSVTEAVSKAILVRNAKTGVMTDSRTNSLIVTDVASNMGKIAAIIRQLDTKVPQVMIQARLVSLNRDTLNQVGINWKTENSTPANPTLAAGGVASQTAGVYTVKTGFLGPGFNLDATLDMLQTKGDIETLLNPSIATVHDMPAKVESIQRVQFVTNIQTIINGNVTFTPQVQQVAVPITLAVTPHVNLDGTVSINTQINFTSVTGQSPGLPPDTTSQSASTILLVRNHETGVIGGILRDVKQNTVSKVPLLGDLPWFLGGALFRSSKVTTTKQELVLFLTPTIQDEI